MRSVRKLEAALPMILLAVLTCSAGPRAATAETAVAQTTEDLVTYCDRYAASEFDDQRRAFGLPFNRVDPKAAIPACREALARNPDSPRVNYLLGRAYLADKQAAKALTFFTKAAQANFALAQVNIGSLYFNGLGVPKDYNEAAKWTLLAAEQGLAPAQASLGQMYLKGQGVAQSYEKAASLLNSAALQGFAPAEYGLAALYASGEGVKQNLGEALRLFGQAANQGYAPTLADFPFPDDDGQDAQSNRSEEGAAADQAKEAALTNDANAAAPAAADALPPPAPAESAAPSSPASPEAPGPAMAQQAPDVPPQTPVKFEAGGGEGQAPVAIVVKPLDHRNSSGAPTIAIEVSPLSANFVMNGLSVNGGACPVYIQDPTIFTAGRALHPLDRAGGDRANLDRNAQFLQTALKRISLPPSPFDQPVLAAVGQYLRFYTDPAVCDVKDVEVIVSGHEWKGAMR